MIHRIQLSADTAIEVDTTGHVRVEWHDDGTYTVVCTVEVDAKEQDERQGHSRMRTPDVQSHNAG